MADQNASPSSFEDLNIFQNLLQKNETLSWSAIPELSKAIDECPAINNQGIPKNVQCIQAIIGMTENAIQQYPSFDLPRLYNVIGQLKMQDKTRALISLRAGIESCNRKNNLFGGCAQAFYDYLLNNNCSEEDFNILLALSVAAYKTGDTINFGRLFIAEYLKQYQNKVLQVNSGMLSMWTYYNQYYRLLISDSNSFHGNFLQTLQRFIQQNPPTFEIYFIISNLKTN